MKITPQSVRAFSIEESGLDTITVYLRDFGPGSGQLLVECYGESWAAFWGSMGATSSLESFVACSPEDYLVTKLGAGHPKKNAPYLLRIVQAVKKAFQQGLPG